MVGQAHMPDAELINWVLGGGSTAVFLLMIWWSRDGTIRWGKSVDDQLGTLTKQADQDRADHAAELARQKEYYANELARVLAEKAEIWELLKLNSSLLQRQVSVTERATHIIEGVTPPTKG